MTESQVKMTSRRQLVRLLDALTAAAILAVCVWAADELLEFSASWVVGAIVSYPLMLVAKRRVLPPTPPLSDKERLHLVPAPVWLFVTITSIVFIHYAAGLAWVVSGAVVAIGTGALLLFELRQRRLAIRRLDEAKHRDA